MPKQPAMFRELRNHKNADIYTRHPEDMDDTCFWCRKRTDPRLLNWEYTPPRTDVGLVAYNLEKWAAANPGDRPYAVKCCAPCYSKMYSRRMSLLTILNKRTFWRSMAVVNDVKVNRVTHKDIVLGSMKPWQVRISTGEVVDKDDVLCSDIEMAAKREYYASIEEAKRVVPDSYDE